MRQATEDINIFEVTVSTTAFGCVGWRATDWCTVSGKGQQLLLAVKARVSSCRVCRCSGIVHQQGSRMLAQLQQHKPTLPRVTKFVACLFFDTVLFCLFYSRDMGQPQTHGSTCPCRCPALSVFCMCTVLTASYVTVLSKHVQESACHSWTCPVVSSPERALRATACARRASRRRASAARGSTTSHARRSARSSATTDQQVPWPEAAADRQEAGALVALQLW